jgi:hypothetical protein
MTTDNTTAAPTPAPAPAPAPAPSAAPVTAASALMADPAAAAAAAATPAPADPAPPADPAAPATLVMPGKDATPEQWSEFYAAIGRPETPEAYELPVPEGDTGEFAKEMAPILHKHGITADQAKGLAADWNAMMAKQSEAMAAADAAHAQAMNTKNTAEAQSLKNEWGPAHTENMELARRAIRQFIPTEKAGPTIAAIESALGYKGTIQLLHSIGKGLGEADAAGLGNNNAGVAVKPLAERLWPSAVPA